MPKFVVKLPGSRETAFYADGDDIFIGRVSSINDICVDSPAVSRQHAHIKRREEGYTIYDLKSLNGVLLNGNRVTRALLSDKDHLLLGDVQIVFHLKSMSREEELQAIESSERTKTRRISDAEEVTTRTDPPVFPLKRKAGGSKMGRKSGPKSGFRSSPKRPKS